MVIRDQRDASPKVTRVRRTASLTVAWCRRGLGAVTGNCADHAVPSQVHTSLSPAASLCPPNSATRCRAAS